MPSPACASSRSPSASRGGSGWRTRPLPKGDVSPRSPARVVTRADARRRAGIVRRIRAFALAEVGEGGRPSAMLDLPRALPAGCTGGNDADGSRRGQGQESQKEGEGTAREEP